MIDYREWAKEQIALYEKDDLVSMHRDFYIDYEKKKKDWKRYVEEINSFLEREHPFSLEDKKDPLDPKLARLKSANTTSEGERSKQKGTKRGCREIDGPWWIVAIWKKDKFY